MERLAALEAEVKADADRKAAAKQVALEKVAAQRAEQQALRDRQAALVTRTRARADDAHDDDDDEPRARGRGGELDNALALARRAQGMKDELARPTGAGEKSWVKSGLASMVLGPLGWLYAGSFREAVPASLAWILFAAVASYLPSLLLMPVLLVTMPLSGIAGVMYAMSYNRAGSRQRLFDKGKKDKALPAGEAKPLGPSRTLVSRTAKKR